MTIVLPLLPFYAERYGASPAVVGLLLATYSLCHLVSGWLIEAERLASWAVLGAALALVGLVLSRHAPSPALEPAKA